LVGVFRGRCTQRAESEEEKEKEEEEEAEEEEEEEEEEESAAEGRCFWRSAPSWRCCERWHWPTAWCRPSPATPQTKTSLARATGRTAKSTLTRAGRWRTRKRELADIRATRPALSKPRFKARVRQICKSQRAQRAAAAYAKGLRRVCKEVISKKGAMARS